MLLKKHFHHKSDIKLNKIETGCGTVEHFNGLCATGLHNLGNLQFQIIDQVQFDPKTESKEDLDKKLLEREQYFIAHTLSMHHGMNSTKVWYSRIQVD